MQSSIFMVKAQYSSCSTNFVWTDVLIPPQIYAETVFPWSHFQCSVMLSKAQYTLILWKYKYNSTQSFQS